MKALAILQNADFEEPGALPGWAKAAGFGVEVYRAYEGELPAPEAFSHLAVLGTPHSVHELKRLPRLERLSDLLAGALANGKSVLGICFGAQLLAHLFGAEVKVGERAEIGWHPFPDSELAAASHLPTGKLFQWHREHFTLPEGCESFGISPVGYLAGFRRGPRVVAIGGHLEITPALVETYIARCWSESAYVAEVAAARGAYWQTPEEMRAGTKEQGKLAEKLFTDWLRA